MRGPARCRDLAAATSGDPEDSTLLSPRTSILAGPPPSTSGPGHGPFKAVARVRIPPGARAVSSAGRAPALQAGGRRFEPCTAHSRKSRKHYLFFVPLPATKSAGRAFATPVQPRRSRSAARTRRLRPSARAGRGAGTGGVGAHRRPCGPRSRRSRRRERRPRQSRRRSYAAGRGRRRRCSGRP